MQGGQGQSDIAAAVGVVESSVANMSSKIGSLEQERDALLAELSATRSSAASSVPSSPAQHVPGYHTGFEASGMGASFAPDTPSASGSGGNNAQNFAFDDMSARIDSLATQAALEPSSERAQAVARLIADSARRKCDRARARRRRAEEELLEVHKRLQAIEAQRAAQALRLEGMQEQLEAERQKCRSMAAQLAQQQSQAATDSAQARQALGQAREEAELEAQRVAAAGGARWRQQEEKMLQLVQALNEARAQRDGLADRLRGLEAQAARREQERLEELKRATAQERSALGAAETARAAAAAAASATETLEREITALKADTARACESAVKETLVSADKRFREMQSELGENLARAQETAAASAEQIVELRRELNEARALARETNQRFAMRTNDAEQRLRVTSSLVGQLRAALGNAEVRAEKRKRKHTEEVGRLRLAVGRALNMHRTQEAVYASQLAELKRKAGIKDTEFENSLHRSRATQDGLTTSSSASSRATDAAQSAWDEAQRAIDRAYASTGISSTDLRRIVARATNQVSTKASVEEFATAATAASDNADKVRVQGESGGEGSAPNTAPQKGSSPVEAIASQQESELDIKLGEETGQRQEPVSKLVEELQADTAAAAAAVQEQDDDEEKEEEKKQEKEADPAPQTETRANAEAKIEVGAEPGATIGAQEQVEPEGETDPGKQHDKAQVQSTADATEAPPAISVPKSEPAPKPEPKPQPGSEQYSVTISEGGKLGLTVKGDDTHRVIRMASGGAGEAAGVRLGSELVSCNGIVVRGMSHTECTRVLTSSTRPVTLTFELDANDRETASMAAAPSSAPAADARREQHQSEPPDGPSRTPHQEKRAQQKQKALEARKDPKSLIGRRVCVFDFDTDERYGTVLRVKKTTLGGTKHEIKFDGCAKSELVRLRKEGQTKGLKFYVVESELKSGGQE